jgi:L-fuculose-phosphate aldolase
MAYRRALNLEEAAVATFRALLLGDTTTTFPPDVARHVEP